MLNLRQIITVIFRQKNKLVIIFGIVVLPVIFHSLIGNSIYEVNAKLLFNRNFNSDISGNNKHTISREKEINSELEILKSKPVFQKTVQNWEEKYLNMSSKLQYMNPAFFKTPGQKEKLIEILKKNIRTEAIESSSIIKVSMRGENSEEISNIINEFCKAYIGLNVQLQQSFQPDVFFAKRITNIRTKLDSLEFILNSFKSAQGIIDYSEQETLLLNKVGSFESRLTEIDKEIINTQARITQMKKLLKQSPKTIIPDKNIDSNPIIQKLKNNIIDLKLKYNELSGKYSSQHRLVKMITDKISKAYSELRNQVKDIIVLEQTTTDALFSEKQAIKTTIAGLHKKIHPIPEKQRIIKKLEYSITETKKVYSLLIQKYEESKILSIRDNLAYRISIINKATPTSIPVGPKMTTKILFAMIFGTIGSLCCIFIIDYNNHSFRNKEDIENNLGLPVFASFRDGALKGVDND